MAVIFSSIANLLLFVIIGYVLAKLGKLNSEHAKILSSLLVWVFLPCKMFRGFSSTFNSSYLRTKWAILIASIVILVLSVTIVSIIVPRVARRDRAIIKYSVLISNYGYIGYALCESIYGETMMSDMMFAALPFSLYVYTEGYRMLMGYEKISLRRLINPIFVGILIGCIFGICGIKLPAILDKITIDASSCMAPVSMILAGITVSEFPIREMISDKRVYLVSLIKLLVLPLTVILVLSPILPRDFVIPISMLFLVPCGLNTVVFPKMVGGNYKLGASIAFVSILMSIVTMPICMKLLNILCK